MGLRSIALIASITLLSACSPDTVVHIVKPYRIDVRQGNYVTQEMLSQLSPGMTQEQVRFIMGSPLLVDVFHADRWDYYYRFTEGYKTPQERRITLFFTDGKLARLEGDITAATGEHVEVPVTPRVIDVTGPAASSSAPAATASAPVAAASTPVAQSAPAAESAPVSGR
jgi:outer membrane protein assembly factor BamE